MPGGLQGCVLENFKKDFLEGVKGDCTLKFLRGGEVVHERKCFSYILEQVAYFSAQANFSEGTRQEFSIDISDFDLAQCLETKEKEFVDATFLVLFGQQCEKLDIALKYSVVRFREYLGLNYTDLFNDRDIYFKNPGGSKNLKGDVKKLLVDMLSCCTDDVANIVIEHHLESFIRLFNPYPGYAVLDAMPFDRAYSAIIDVMEALCIEGRLTPIAKKVCVWLCAEYTIHPQKLCANGFGTGFVRLIELFSAIGCQHIFKFVHNHPEARSRHIALHYFKDMAFCSCRDDCPDNFSEIENITISHTTRISELEAISFLLNHILRPWAMFICGCHGEGRGLPWLDNHTSKFHRPIYARWQKCGFTINQLISDKDDEIKQALVLRLQNAEQVQESTATAGSKRRRQE